VALEVGPGLPVVDRGQVQLDAAPARQPLGGEAARAGQAAPVGRGDHQQAAGRHLGAQRAQAGARVLEVLEHVGQRDQVERALGRLVGAADPGLEPVGRADPLQSLLRQRHRLGREVDPDPRVAAPGEVLEQEAGAAAHVEHPAAGPPVAVDGRQVERHPALQVPVAALDGHQAGRDPVVIRPDVGQALAQGSSGRLPPACSRAS
jgi:hypothetical protein